MNRLYEPSKINRMTRDSNFELLRIVAMFLVLVIHADFYSLGIPTSQEMVNHPVSSLMRYIVESFSLVCVNVYILISGYFGIKVKFKSILSFLFMIEFWRVLVLLGLAVLNLLGRITVEIPSGIDFVRLLIPGYDDWFVGAYILLLFISPMLNAWLEITSISSINRFLTLYLGFELLMAWLLNAYNQFGYGYSVLSFIGLYILGAAIKRIGIVTGRTWRFGIKGYVLVSICAGVLYFIGAYMFPDYGHVTTLVRWFKAYNSLNVMVGSVLLFRVFS